MFSGGIGSLHRDEMGSIICQNKVSDLLALT